MDPILQEAQPHAAALPALTQPMATTLADTFYYFHSTQPHCATVRTDGKRITFHNHYHKTNIIEDVKFLRECIQRDPQGPFKEVLGAEVEQAEAVIDPIAHQKKVMRAQILAELAAEGVLPKTGLKEETVVKIIEGTGAVAEGADATVAAITQEDVNAQNAQAQAVAGVDAAAAARAKLAALRTGSQSVQGAVISPLTGTVAPQITPVSTADIAGAAAGSSSTVA